MIIKYISRFALVGVMMISLVELSGQPVRINEFSAFSEAMSDYENRPVDDWRSSGFDDSDWGQSTLPMGMDRGTFYQFPDNLYSEMFLKATSLYSRSSIHVEEAIIESDEPVVLSIDYDDAFILYINGVEIVRENIGLPGVEAMHNARATESHPASNDLGQGIDRTEQFPLGKASGLFIPGRNTLAVQVFTESLNSNDAYLNLQLQAGETILTEGTDLWTYFIGVSEPGVLEPYPDIISDWIELYNPSDEIIELEGWSLSDDADDSRKWIFPEASIAPEGFLLVLATGEDVMEPGSWLQAPFKLSSSGEYLGLFDAEGVAVSEFSPEYPSQVLDTSYGWDKSSSSYRFFTEITPGWTNPEPRYIDIVEDTTFSIDRGFYDEPFEVEITTKTEGATIRYTTDGSTPSPDHGEIYSSAIAVNRTTILRAIAYKENYLSTNVDTQSYIFIRDVITQGNSPEGYPATWKSVSNNPDLPADYEMDPEVTGDPLYKDKMREALLSIPTMSLVTDIEHLFDRDTGIYMNPLKRGSLWERPVSIEIIYPNGREGYQINCGLRAQGGSSRNPEKMPKRSFRLAFRKEYGKGELDFPLFDEPDATVKIDTIVLRGAHNHSWLHHNGWRNGGDRERAQYVRDQFAKDMQGRMGWPYLHNNYVYLYINGLFWGLYNPTERATNGFGAAYLGGEEEDYDALNSGEVLDGNSRRWKELQALMNSNLGLDANYQQVAELLDLEQFTDYMLLNHWGGNEDWDSHNWYALGNREDGKFQFYLWDSEYFFEAADSNTVYNQTENKPGGIFHSLLDNREYQLLVADRIYKHFYNDGALTTGQALEEWNEWSTRVYEALIAESARWGDYRRDVHRQSGPFVLYTRDDQWEMERARLLNFVIPARNEVTYLQYEAMGLIPHTPVPEFSTSSGAISESDPLVLSTPPIRAAEIYYTLDGLDPRLPGGAISPTAILFGDPIPVHERTTVRARVRNWSGWSPMREADFYPDGDPADLVISEIYYAPLDGSEFEFIELYNRGRARISLNQVKLGGGIQFSFPDGLFIDPDQYLLVAGNSMNWTSHPSGDQVAGQFSGNLANEGELVILEHENLGILQQVVYSSGYPWPAASTEEGCSLVPVNQWQKPRPTQSTAWRASKIPGGSPGREDIGQPGWILHPVFGWVYSESGQTGPGSWLWLSSGFVYVGSLEETGGWLWFLKPSGAGN